jgi:hypothetical protein
VNEHTEPRDRNAERRAYLVLGGLLVLAGVAWLLARTAGVDLPALVAAVGWPVFVVAPGLVLLALGLSMPRQPGQGMAVGGTIVTSVGLLLAYQDATDHWSSWAYAWALIGPAAAGLGQAAWGALHRHSRDVAEGGRTLGVGLVMFGVGYAFFEGLIGIGDGRGISRGAPDLVPFLLLGAGLLVIAGGLLRRQEAETRLATDDPPVASSPPPSSL